MLIFFSEISRFSSILDRLLINDWVSGEVPIHPFNTPTEIKTAVDALNLSATTDFIFVVPISGREGWLVFKVERAAA